MGERLKILMFGWEFPPFNSGGLGTACLGITRALARQGHEITFVLPRQLDLHVDYMDVVFADVPRLKVKAVNSLLAGYVTDERYRVLMSALPPDIAMLYGKDLYGETQRYAEKAYSLAQVIDHDVIHAHDWLAFPAGMAAKAASGRPLVAHVHATEFDRTAEGKVNQLVYDSERAGMHAADRVIAVSNYTREKVAAHYGVPDAKIEVVHNGIDPREPSSLPLSRLKKRHRIVLFLGRITVQKGPDWFLKTAKLVIDRAPDAIFVLAGAGDMERQIIMEAASMGLAEHVIFTGFRRGADIDRLYRMADLYVLPSVSEPFGITALEAVQQGTPVLVSKQSGVREILPTAAQADFWDTRKMADAILRLLAKPDAASELVKAQRENLRHCTWDASAAKIAGIYRRTLATTPAQKAFAL